MHDLVIRGGTVIDGTGAEARHGDVAIDGPIITEVGEVDGRGSREIDANGRLVLPGWVDIHTHYDGQAVWDPWLTPSSWHGVTTTVFGNCGVGFAPVRPGSEDFLITLMEGVEDIPGSVLAEGLDFEWESFPAYLDALENRPHIMDFGTQIPHAALRFYVMGDRGADHGETPTEDERATMAQLVGEAIDAGAMGFSTSRTTKHRSADGRPTPSLSAGDPELAAIADALGRAGAGMIQCNSDFGPGEVELLAEMGRRSGRPVSVLLLQVHQQPELWRQTLAGIHDANQSGVRMTGQVGCRPIGVMMGLEVTVNPFREHPAYQAIADLPLADRVARLSTDSELRRSLIEERPRDPFSQWMEAAVPRSYELGDPPDYEPDPARSLGARAEASGRSVWELALDLLCEDNGSSLLLHPFENYSAGNLDAIREMLLDPHTICGLGDGGAHVATICDASYPTTLLTIWGRDRVRGEGLPLEFVVHKQTRATATAFGLHDRGAIERGLRADVNIIDFDQLGVSRPAVQYDLPAGGRRLVQRSHGYAHTFVGGVEVARDGEHTGELPGRLLRGAS